MAGVRDIDMKDPRMETLTESYERSAAERSQESTASTQPNSQRSPHSSLHRPLSFERHDEGPLDGSMLLQRTSSNVNDQSSHQSQNTTSMPRHSTSLNEQNSGSSNNPAAQQSYSPSSSGRAIGAPLDFAHRPFQKNKSRIYPPPLTTLERLRQAASHPWLLEIASCLLACLSFFAIISTLAVHEGRPLPEWPDLISINSLIAIFNTVLKGCLVMPVAEGMCRPYSINTVYSTG